jgi:hypothetical protein
MTKEQIQTLRSSELHAIVRSTNPAGRFWQQMVWARDELARHARDGLITESEMVAKIKDVTGELEQGE